MEFGIEKYAMLVNDTWRTKWNRRRVINPIPPKRFKAWWDAPRPEVRGIYSDGTHPNESCSTRDGQSIVPHQLDRMRRWLKESALIGVLCLVFSLTWKRARPLCREYNNHCEQRTLWKQIHKKIGTRTYNKRDSLTSRYKVSLDGLTYHQYESMSQSFFCIQLFYNTVFVTCAFTSSFYFICHKQHQNTFFTFLVDIFMWKLNLLKLLLTLIYIYIYIYIYI